MIHKKNTTKNIAYRIMRLYIRYNTIDDFIIIMVIGLKASLKRTWHPWKIE